MTVLERDNALEKIKILFDVADVNKIDDALIFYHKLDHSISCKFHAGDCKNCCCYGACNLEKDNPSNTTWSYLTKEELDVLIPLLSDISAELIPSREKPRCN